MITTAAIGPNGSPAPSVSGRQGNAAVSPNETRQEFLNAVGRLSFAASPDIGGLTPETQIPDTTRTSGPEDRVSAYREVARDRPRDDSHRNETSATVGATGDDARQHASAAPEETNRTPADRTTPAPRPDGHESTHRAVPAGQNSEPVATQTQTTTARQPLQSQQLQPGTPAPQDQTSAAQNARTTAQNNGAIKAQIVDDGAPDQLPQTTQTLSSRAALVVQAQSTKGANEQPAQTGVRENGVSSLFASAAQTAANGAAKGKGSARAGASAQVNGTQNAAGTQSAQATAANAAAAATPVAQPQQQTFANTQFGNGQPGQQPFSAKADPFTQAGTAQNAPQFNLRAAANTTPARPAPPVPPRVVTNQVAVQIQKAAGQGNDRISIQLKPADLGRVEVRLDVGADGRVAAVITADRADTLDMLQRDARILQNSLQNAGLQADSNSLSFELKGQNQAFNDGPNGSPGNGENSDTETDVPADDTAGGLATQTGVITDDRIDIQV